MVVRWHSFSSVRLSLAAMLTVLAVPRPTAHAQTVSGAIAASATILPPAARQEIRVTAFSVTGDGIVRLETTAPIAGAVSQIVMRTVSSSVNGFVPIQQAPMRIEGSHRRESPALAPSRTMPATRVRYELDLGKTRGPAPGSSQRNLMVRIDYLIVPGT